MIKLRPPRNRQALKAGLEMAVPGRAQKRQAKEIWYQKFPHRAAWPGADPRLRLRLQTVTYSKG